MSRTVRGVGERYALERTALRSAEARWLAERANPLAQRFSVPAKLKLDSQEPSVADPATAYDRIIGHGRRGLSVQRFKAWER